MTQIIGYSSTDSGTVSSKGIRDYTFVGGVNDDRVQTLFSLFLFDLNTKLVAVPEVKLDPSELRDKAEFYFHTPPKSIEMTEPFATRITPSQNSGMFVESHGIVIRQIRIQGTTGFRPNMSRVAPTPNHIVQERQLLNSSVAGTGLAVPATEITGHDDFIFLRNIFRYYSDQVKSNTRRLVMVFRNAKDDDYWIVEPDEGLKMTRSSSSPLTYDYSISLKALARYKNLVNVDIKDPMKGLRDVRRTASRLQQYSNIIVNNVLFLSTQINRAKALGYTGLNQTIGKATAIVRGLNTVKSNAQDVPKLRQAAVDYLSDLNSAIDQLAANSPPGDPLIRNLRRLYILICTILTEQILRDNIASNLSNTQSRVNNAYTGNNSNNGTGPGTISQGIVNLNEDIRSLSKRLTGSPDNWRTIVQINGLKPPYVTSDPFPQSGVLGVGDTVIFPSNKSRDIDPANIQSASANSPSENLADGYYGGPVVQSYGRDIRLKSSQAGDQGYQSDLEINQSGDISTIAGVPNVEQGILLKFSTEKGELPRHPDYGAAFPIGTRMIQTSFNDFRLTTVGTITSDNRIKSIKSLKFSSSGDILTVSAVLELIDSRNILTTDFALRRF